MPFLPHLRPEYYEYAVRPGDTLSGIVHTMYGARYQDPRYKVIVERLLAINPHITHPDRIRAGDILRLSESAAGPTNFPGPRAAGVPVPERLATQDIDPADREAYWALSWLEHNHHFLTVPGAIAFGGGANLLSGGNIRLIQEVGEIYANYKAGRLTKGKYDYERRKRLNQLRANLGPMERWLFSGRTSPQSIRIARGGGIPATAHIESHSHRLMGLSRHARMGGVLLAGVGLTAACREIAHETDQDKKNDILVESVTGTLTAAGLGMAVGLVLLVNPVGWGAALILAAGTAAWGYNAGRGARYFYDTRGRQIDFVSETGVDRVCG